MPTDIDLRSLLHRNVGGIDCVELHKRIENRIQKLEQPTLGLKGQVFRSDVLRIIEEEFGQLDYVWGHPNNTGAK